MPVKQYTDLIRMLDDVAEYVRRHRVEVFWNDNVNTNTHQITAGSDTTWAIAREYVARPGRGGSDKEWQMHEAMRTSAGKTALLKTLNAMKNAPPLAPRTVWARLLDDD